MPADPMPAAAVDLLLARAGLDLTDAERAGIRDASRFIVGMAARVRPPGRGIEAEPAVTFAARDAGR